MSVGRQWVRRLALLLAAGLVVQVPGLLGVGVSGASADGTYAAALTIDSKCVATVTVTWSKQKPQAIQSSVNDLTSGHTDGPVNESVTANTGTASVSFQTNLDLLPLGDTNHDFNSVENVYSGSSWVQIYTNSVNAPCYWGSLV